MMQGKPKKRMKQKKTRIGETSRKPHKYQRSILLKHLKLKA